MIDAAAFDTGEQKTNHAKGGPKTHRPHKHKDPTSWF